MLNFNTLQKQFAGFGYYQAKERRRKAVILENVREVFRALVDQDAASLEISPGRPDQLIALPLEEPATIQNPIQRPTPITVAATDGSQIYPDRNIEPLCYLLNVGRIAFQYGTEERPLMDAIPHLYFKGQGLDDLAGLEIEVVGQEIVSALRDELELSTLFEIATSIRKTNRPIVALADGTLIKWMLKRLRKPALEQRLLQRYFDTLEKFKEQKIPLCSYISMPGNTEFINYLSCVKASSNRPSREVEGFEGISDRMLFKEVLLPGQRSAVFKSQSLVLKAYPPEQEICYFYVHVAGDSVNTGVNAGVNTEIARVEFPFWLSRQPELLNLIHSTLLSECEKGGGYPMILSEAHEQAIVRGQERALFYEMIERNMNFEGEHLETSSKQASKKRPVL